MKHKINQPQGELGAILDEQARQAVPDSLEGWSAVLNRLQAEKLPLAVPPSTHHLPPPPNFVERARPRPRQRLALTGLGLVAGLALTVVIGATLLSTNPAHQSITPVANGRANSTTIATLQNSPQATTNGARTVDSLGVTTTVAATTREPAPTLTVTGESAFKGQGKLAVVRLNHLAIVDGATSNLQEIVQAGASGQIGPIGWSYNGRWLAYVITSSRPPSSTVWLMRDDGAVLRQLSGYSGFQWSPVAEELSLVPDGTDSKHCCAWITTPTGTPYALVGGTNPQSAYWSPDGKDLAVVVTYQGQNPPQSNVDSINVITKNGGASDIYNAKTGDGLKIIGWWPDGNGILYQTLPSRSASVAADGLPLQSISLENVPGRQKNPLLVNLVHFQWLTFSPDGQQLVGVEGGKREVWDNKYLMLCQITASSCRSITRPGDKVAIDPALSPDGKQLAFVQADGLNWVQATQQARTAWPASRTLWTADSTGANAKLVGAAGTGVIAPRWSKDSKHIVYERSNALWLLDLTKNQATALVTDLVAPGEDDPLGYYGFRYTEVAWYQP